MIVTLLKYPWKAVKTIRFHSMLAVVFYVGIFLYVLYAVKHNNIDFLLLLFFSGALGGVISTYIRVKSLPLMDKEEAVTRMLAVLQIYITPIIAGIFGFLLYLLFASGLLTGALFPEFSGLENPFETAQSMIEQTKVKTNLDGIKALVWSFIAGFSEKMVPNILDKIAKDSEKKEIKNPIHRKPKSKN